MVKYPLINRFYGWLHGSAPRGPAAEPVIAPAMMNPYGSSSARYSMHDGEKFPGGFGYTELMIADYWTLRARSKQLFQTNLYGRGIIARLVTNIVNTGLALEATPEPGILGQSEDTLADWSESIENRFHLWERSPELCDWGGEHSFGAVQAAAKRAALISGDVLVVLQQDEATGLPRVRLVDANCVQTPFGLNQGEPKLAAGHCIKHGVELDAQGRHVAYWIVAWDEATKQNKITRLLRMGANGRRVAWLVYGTDRMLDSVRGEPLLSIVLQSLREIDRYRDAVQRKAAINAIVAMFIQKEVNVPGTRPITGGAVVRGTATLPGTVAGVPRRFNFAEMHPGFVIDELAVGETPQGFLPNGTDEKFGDFEAAVINAIAWCYQVPPEIMRLSFSSNYSASQAAINEFKLFLNVVRTDWGDTFCQPIYVDWLLSEALTGRVKASGFLESWRTPLQYDRFAAWCSADWCGAIKPSVDITKMAKGYEVLVKHGWISNDRAARETTGTKFSKNIKKIERENLQIVEANRPIVELEKPPPPAAPPGGGPAGPKAPPGKRPRSEEEAAMDELVKQAVAETMPELVRHEIDQALLRAVL